MGARSIAAAAILAAVCASAFHPSSVEREAIAPYAGACRSAGGLAASSACDLHADDCLHPAPAGAEALADAVDAVDDFRRSGWIEGAAPVGPPMATCGGKIDGGFGVQPLPFPRHWINGSDCTTEPKIQVHWFNDDTCILRQSLCTHFEGPFIYLLFGRQKVLMQDTGAGSGLPLAATVYAIIDDWLDQRGLNSIQLVVTHSHAHGDHIAYDSQFVGKPNTVVVGQSAAAVQSFFGITGWPDQIVQYDLGGRVLSVIPIPGHQAAHVALYDPTIDVLFTGDTLYPGRLYFPTGSFSTYLASIQRMVDFTADKPVKWVLGTHIEMSTTPGVDFPIGSKYHPNEHPLQLTRDTLLELHQALLDMQGGPIVKEVHDDFIIYPL